MATYNITHDGKILYSGLTDDEYFDRMEDLALEYYLTGTPNPGELEIQIIREDD